MDVLPPDTASNPFESSAPTVVAEGAGALAVVEREKAEIQGAIFMAKKFPRDEHAAFGRIMKAVGRPRLAEAARYKFPRGGKPISGPSVALARELARCWGNVRSGFRVVEANSETIHLKGYAIDLETNAYFELEDKFERLVQRKIRGETKWVAPDERDLRELVNKRGALLERNCLLKLIPPDVVETALAESEKTLIKAAKGDLKQSRDDTIRAIVRVFLDFGVSTEDLEDWLDHPLEQITELELADLREMYSSIRDGNSKPSDYFRREKKAETGQESELNALVKEQKKKSDKQTDVPRSGVE